MKCYNCCNNIIYANHAIKMHILNIFVNDLLYYVVNTTFMFSVNCCHD